MVGAIEFLRKARAICKSKENCTGCQLWCGMCDRDLADITNEDDIVREVIAYEIKEEE